MPVAQERSGQRLAHQTQAYDRHGSVGGIAILHHVLFLERVGGHGRILNVHTDMKVKRE
ncbi:hypothetical protein ACTMTI_05155 [Nonomuraea sp. H19]|uniref:hypothetical protein n=1 Tax=Nonomuraea sp. H19 TaxID=3452206 RepID=UPI003F89B932